MYAAEPQPPVLGRGALAWLVSVSRLLAWLACCVFAALCSLPCASCACCARCSGQTLQTGDFRKHRVPKPKANRKRTESDLSINGPQPPRVDFEASGAPIKITLSNSRTANRVKHSVRNLLHGGLRVGHVLLWFDWMQSMSLPLMHEATIRKRMAKLIRMRAVTGILGRIFLTEQKPKAKMRDC